MASIRDSNLYTLLLRPSSDPNILQLIDASRGSEVRYLRVRDTESVDSYGKPKLDYAAGGYDASLYDAYSHVKLASVSASSAKAKSRKLELHNPDLPLLFEFTGTLSFEWTFTFEGYQFRWTRPAFHSSDYICSIERKPDPSVQLCLGREPGKGKDGVVQLLHYNLERFEFEDPKGIEIAMYISLLSIFDANEERLSGRDRNTSGQVKPVASTNGGSAGSSSQAVPTLTARSSHQQEEEQAVSHGLLMLPTGETLNIILDFIKDINEVIVRSNGSAEAYASEVAALLADKNILFVVIKTREADSAAIAVQVAEATKRIRHRAGLDQDGKGLFQYVREEEIKRTVTNAVNSKNQPRVIDLNDAPVTSSNKKGEAKGWEPPSNISIFLSKIELPELHPSRIAAAKSRSPPSKPQAPVPVPGASSSSRPVLPPKHSSGANSVPSRPTPRPSPQQLGSTNSAVNAGRSDSTSITPKPPVQPYLPSEPEPFGLGSARSKIAARLFSR